MKGSASRHDRECCKGSHDQEDGGHLLDRWDSIRSRMKDCNMYG
jgi:hypothetical protein